MQVKGGGGRQNVLYDSGRKKERKLKRVKRVKTSDAWEPTQERVAET